TVPGAFVPVHPLPAGDLHLRDAHAAARDGPARKGRGRGAGGGRRPGRERGGVPNMTTRPRIYGLLAEFASIEALVEAVRAARREGYTRLDAYTPAPVEGLAEELGFHRSRLPWVVFAGGLVGCVGGFVMQWYAAEFSYPLNIGGRPLFSWPAFI